MNQDGFRNNTISSLLGSNDGVNDQGPSSISKEEFSREVLTQINELKRLLEGKGNDYVKCEVIRLIRELRLVANLIALQNGGQLCLDLL